LSQAPTEPPAHREVHLTRAAAQLCRGAVPARGQAVGSARAARPVISVDSGTHPPPLPGGPGQRVN